MPPTCSPHLRPVELQVTSRGRTGLQPVWAQGLGGVVQAGGCQATATGIRLSLCSLGWRSPRFQFLRFAAY